MEITTKYLDDFSDEFKKDSKNFLARNAVTSSNLNKIVINRDRAQQQNRIFSKKIVVKTKASNQNMSGRCWLFALCNMMRIPMIKKYKLSEDFEFSAAYLAFFDKLERSNFFLSQIVKYRKEQVNSRINYILMNEPISDGGNWNMILNLVNKYGIIPKTCFNESVHSSNTANIDEFLNNKLRDYAYLIRNLSDLEMVNLDSHISNMMNEIFRILVIFMGQPPKKINWEYTSKDTYKIVKMVEPLEFYKKYVPINLNDYVLLADNPILNYNTHFTVNDFNNMKNGREIAYLNVGIENIKNAIRESINGQSAVWFGCDVGKYLNKELAVLDTGLFNYKSVFNTEIKLNKKNRLLYKNSDVTHAMIIRGYDNKTQRFENCNDKTGTDKSTNTSKTSIPIKRRTPVNRRTPVKVPKKVSKKASKKASKNTTKTKQNKSKRSKKIKQKGGAKRQKQKKGKSKTPSKKVCDKNKLLMNKAPISKYLVENSWGLSPVGDENLVMTDAYLTEFMYIIAVNKKYVPNKLVNIQNKKPHRLNLWDPFGYLLF